MSNLELFADDIDGYLYVAIVNNGKLEDLYVNKPFINGSWGSIYLGKIIKVDARQDAAFVDLGNGLMGYLPATYALVRKPGKTTPRQDITKMVRNGDTFLVQIKTEGKEKSPYENHKLPRLTANIQVPGGFLVYNPHSDNINYSSDIDEKTIDKLKVKVERKGGWKVYPSALKLSNEEIDYEASYLKERWKEIRSGEKNRLVCRLHPHRNFSPDFNLGQVQLFFLRL